MLSRTVHFAIFLLFWIAFALVLTGLLRKNRGFAKLHSDGQFQFSPRWWFVCSWAFIVVRFGFIGSDYLRSGLKEPLQLATGALICIAAVGSVALIPRSLLTKNETLEEAIWFWRRKKIRWSEIQEINTEKESSTITVIGSGDRKIAYTNVYPDRPRFLLEIKRHCGDNLPPEFPNE